ncbi:efflux RND transporter periplasmic adaptor subunit [Marinobacter daepoensis]|uniref:efflux RND transporter periplasmic adaptor subunit n=1 Tax=Marinobacter daepoensis TaxID=262077 RepID=UPI0003F8D061|nr:biotin/lipoyl-binding protein [Marinobacter daepoensis]
MFRKLLPLLIIVVGIAGFLLLKATRPEPAEVVATERSWLVQVQEVRPATATPVLPLYGEVVAPDLQTVTATLSGRIGQLPVREGVRVTAGDVLVSLDEEDVAPVLAQAKAQVADLEAQIQSEQVRYRNDRRSLESEMAILDNARRQFQRIDALVARNLASQENREAATDALARAELTVRTREKSVAEHPARLLSLEARLAQARASLAATELDSERATATAPFDGIVTNLQVAAGDQVSPGQALLSVYPSRGLEVRARVPQMYLRELTRALAAGHLLEAQADSSGHRFELIRFAGLSDPAGTEAVLRVVGDAGELRPGALQPLTLSRLPRDQVVAIPFSALYGADSVYVLDDDNRMQRLSVERVGEAHRDDGGRRLLIASDDLKAGMKLITTHLPNAVTGLKVRVADEAGVSGS